MTHADGIPFDTETQGAATAAAPRFGHDLETIRNTLAQFTGTTCYYRIMGNFTCTDGVHYLADRCGAVWLLTAIISHQTNPKVRREGMQVWKLTLEGRGALLTCTDGNYRELVTQRIDYTDFPLPEGCEIWVEGDVLLLPSEH